ncbi:JmjC domain-containing protein [Colletotrichum sublineola]|uniref:Putative JmjC domain-containing protein n=1 Tax=Colletotrichum sublineola TaxID=1173701 RepID=A0A066XE48_COLSU|nr:JmjC domain-containing protein [Colletotrichum sublineola]KDN65934.1 putative JmjC domain-containing protein [Colletotrichum sublineola]
MISRIPGCCCAIRSSKPRLAGRSFSTITSVEVTKTSFSAVDISEFRESVFKPGTPRLFKQPATSSIKSPFPASSKWFEHDEAFHSKALTQGPTVTFARYMDQFAHHMLPYELMSPQLSEDTGLIISTTNQFLNWLASSSDPMGAVLAGIVHAASHPEASEPRFSSFTAPFLLLLKAVEFNRLHENKIKQLYVAQAQLHDLPPELQDDLPVPHIVKGAGKGDVYNSSVWLGLEPTYTPLHRDPNPNLFCQLVGEKAIRILPPSSGDRLYRRVQMQIQQSGNSRIRTTEMMEGRERVVMNAAVWGMEGPEDIVEARLGPGDALFIPTGWWHSVKSGHHDGRLNASVNWWFR